MGSQPRKRNHDDSADQLAALNDNLTQQAIEKAKALCGGPVPTTIKTPNPDDPELRETMEQLRKRIEIDKRDTDRVLSAKR